MNGVEVGVAAGSCLLVGTTLFLVPVLSAPTLPLGVSVPRARIDDPAVHRAVRNYRVAVAGLTLLALAATVATGAGPEAVTVPAYGLLAAGFLALLMCRKSIRDAKGAGDWYRDLPVRLVAPISPDDVHRAPVPVVPYALAAGLLLATAGFGALRYPGLPDPFPTHWNGSGEPDAFGAKGPWTVFGPLVVSAALLGFLLLLTRLVRVSPLRARADEARPFARAEAGDRAGQGLLAVTAFLVTGLVCALSVDGWLHPAGLELLVPALTGFGVAFLAALLVTTAPVRAVGREPGRAEAVDDDRRWRGGVLHVNRDDPSLLVPKRVGVGWTINAGHPAGRAITIGLLVLVVAGVVLPIAFG